MIKIDGTINGGTISNNKAVKNCGGGIRADGKVTVNSGKIVNNSANESGGGIDWTYGMVFLNGGNIENNLVNEEENNISPEFSSEENNWMNFENLNITPIDVALEKKYERSADISDISLQGMTITDKYIVFAQMKSESENTKINIVDKNTYKILNSVEDYCFGHANNIAYNSKDGKCYMSYTKDNKSYVTSFKINDNQQFEDMETKELDKTYFGLTYDEDDNYFIGIYGKEIYILDENFDTVLKSFKYSENNLTKQDIMYYKGHIYFSCYEAGKKTTYQTTFNNREKGSNVIYVYNMDGILQKTLYISNKDAYGEIEGAAMDADGKLIAGYNTDIWTSISFYSSNYLNGVNSIEISSLPLKTKYIQNYENLDLTGGELTIDYNNGIIDKISLTNENVKVSGFDNTKLGKNTIEIEYAGQKDSYEVEIINKTDIANKDSDEADQNEKIENTENTEQISDNTIAKTELPKAGKQNILVIFIVSAIIVSGVLIKKLKEYKYIK